MPADKFVIVVADFSSGNPDEGREIADEVASHLSKLQSYGIDAHVLVGKVRPGVVIRSEEMARDVGKHLPPDASFAVIWGTMSPRTAGRYRPHLTCVQKIGPDRGTSVSFSLNLASEELPLKGDPEQYQRECYERLVGVACAAVPICYAMNEVRQSARRTWAPSTPTSENAPRPSGSRTTCRS